MARSAFLDTGAVAGILGWHPNTIRDHLIPAETWHRGCGEIPSVKIGGRYMIPRWWVDEIVAIGTKAPRSAEGTAG